MTNSTSHAAALLTTSQVAEQLHVHQESVRRMLAHGLPAVNISTGTGVKPRWRVRQADLDEWLSARTITAEEAS
jgi:excisionase family DNA binding protein